MQPIKDENVPFDPPPGLTLVRTPSGERVEALLAEEGEDLILRGYETAGRETVAEIQFGLEDLRCTVTWKPYEIKTLRWKRGEPVPVEVDMLEDVRQDLQDETG